MSNTPPANWKHMMAMAAQDGQLIVCSCFYCRKREIYWAADLLLVYGDMPIEDFGARCRCGNSDGTRTRVVRPGGDDVGRVQLQRPIGWTMRWHWHSEWLELPLRPLEGMDRPLTMLELERKQSPRSAPKFERWDKPAGYAPPVRRR